MKRQELKLVAEWTWVKRFVDEIVQAAEQCDIPWKGLGAACMLSGEARRVHLQKLGEEVRSRQEGLVSKPETGRIAIPLCRAGLVQNAVASLRRLALSGDERAGAALTYVILLHTDHARDDDQLRVKTFHSEGRPGTNLRSSTFSELNRKLDFARDVGRSLYLDEDRPTWNTPRPAPGDVALLVLCEHSSALFARRYKLSSHWHIVRIKEVRRTRFTATLLTRPDLSEEAGRIRTGQNLDYPIAAVVAVRRPRAKPVEPPFTFRIPSTWRAVISEGAVLPVLGREPWPSKFAGRYACFRANDEARLNLYLVDLAHAGGAGGWDDNDFFMSFALEEIDRGADHTGRIGDERIRVRCVWDEA